MDSETIAAICTAISFAIGNGISFFINLKQMSNNKKLNLKNCELENVVKHAEVLTKIPSYINEAEAQIGSGSGYVKNAIVMNNLRSECLDRCIDFPRRELEQSVEAILTTPQKKTKLEKEDLYGKENEVVTKS